MSLYKYVAPHLWRNILADGFIRFTQPSAFNDPFEMQPYFECLDEEAELRKGIQNFINDNSVKDFLEVGLQVAYMEIPNEVKTLISFDKFKSIAEYGLKRDKREIEEAVELVINMMSNKNGQLTADVRNQFLCVHSIIGVLSLSEKRDNLLMWAHYAQNHEGFVIEFDESHDFFHQKPDPNDIPPLKLLYSAFGSDKLSNEQWDFIEKRARELPPLSQNQQKAESSQSEDMEEESMGRPLKVIYAATRPHRRAVKDITAADILLTKSKDWEYEQEWRMLQFLHKADKKIPNEAGDIHLFLFPPLSIRGVIFGCRMSASIKEEISNLLTADKCYSHVKIYKAVLDDKGFRLNIVPTFSYASS
jgi:hypothetical protein